MLVFTGKLRDHPRNEIENELYRFRNRIFSGRLGWDVESYRGLERDSFDSPDTHWVLIEDSEGICGCIRMLDCSGTYMLSTIFFNCAGWRMPSRHTRHLGADSSGHRCQPCTSHGKWRQRTHFRHPS